jgi:hypothetical protein
MGIHNILDLVLSRKVEAIDRRQQLLESLVISAAWNPFIRVFLPCAAEWIMPIPDSTALVFSTTDFFNPGMNVNIWIL